MAGLRVMRGPGWSQGNANGGDCHVGTVTSVNCDDGTVEVEWDSGQIFTTKSPSNELLVLDNAITGVHFGIACIACQENQIAGILWKCAECPDINLCSSCYFGDQHDCSHHFMRQETIDNSLVTVERRGESIKRRVLGLFPYAKVVRGRDWEWDDQDGIPLFSSQVNDTQVCFCLNTGIVQGKATPNGTPIDGPGHEGTIIDLVTPVVHSPRSTVRVQWQNGTRNVYRAGFQGKVDVRCIEEAPGGDCYPDHLPVCTIETYVKSSSEFQPIANQIHVTGETACSQVNLEADAESSGESETTRPLDDGDYVQMDENEKVREKQKSHDKFITHEQVLATVEKIVQIDSKGDAVDAVVKIDCEQQLLSNPPCVTQSSGQPAAEISPHSAAFTSDDQDVSSLTKSPPQKPHSGNIKAGDYVNICVGIEELKHLQQTGSGFAVGMAECIGKCGEVKGFAVNGDAIVTFGAKKFRLAPAALKKAMKISVGDHVRVLADEANIQELQNGHGGYGSHMKSSLGKVGKVVKFMPTGDVVVEFDSRTSKPAWVFNPACLVPAPGEKLDVVEGVSSLQQFQRALLGAGGGITFEDMFKSMLEVLGGSHDFDVSDNDLIKAILQTDVIAVKAVLEKDPTQVGVTVKGGISALHLAVDRGSLEIVKVLVESGANIGLTDTKGNTPLHVSKKEEIAEYLINKSCDLHAANKKGVTPAHCAARNGSARILRLLQEHGADMTAKDRDGDTPLHYATLNEHLQASEVLIGCPGTAVRCANNKQELPLHFSALAGAVRIVELLLLKDGNQINDQDENGMTPLHLAVMNNHTATMKILLKQGKASVHIKTKLGHTALHMAAERGNMDSVKILVEHGADVNAADCKGDRPLHILLAAKLDKLDALLIFMVTNENEKAKKRVCIAQYLLEAGADIHARNVMGKGPLDECTNDVIADGVKRFLAENPNRTKPETLNMKASPDVVSTLTDLCIKCLLHPQEILLVPCGHKTCRPCSEDIHLCPQCKRQIKEKYDKDGNSLKEKCVIM